MSGATVRAEVVVSMREVGMSTRAIASATGIDRKTVMNDLSQVVQNGPPATPPIESEPMPKPAPTLRPSVTGTDGKTYAATAPTPKPRTLKKQTNVRGVIGAFSVPDLT